MDDSVFDPDSEEARRVSDKPRDARSDERVPDQITIDLDNQHLQAINHLVEPPVEKCCNTCARVKRFEDFHLNAGAKDGHRGECKECHNTYKRTFRAAHPELCQARDRERRAQNAEHINKLRRARRLGIKDWVNQQQRQWRASHPERVRFFHLQQKERHPIKYAAQRQVTVAIKNGTLVQPDRCENCGDGAAVVGHHCDYAFPMEVMWLCVICHTTWHRKNGAGLNGDGPRVSVTFAAVG